MNNTPSRIGCSVLLIVTAAAASYQTQAQTSVYEPITYQGRLMDGGSGASGAYDFQFRLYDGTTNAASQIGSTVTFGNVLVASGLFTAGLDFGNNAFTGGPRWLEIDVRANNNGTNANGPFSTLTPRQPLTPAPYALYAPAAGVATVANGVSSSTIIQGPSLQIGLGNSVIGTYSTVTGGTSNSASGSYTAVLGGAGNTAGKNFAAVGGGLNNIADGDNALVAGGESNSAIGDHAFVGGGAFNSASGYDAVGGGAFNSVSADYSGIFGGELNHISEGPFLGDHSFIGGGRNNSIGGSYAVIGGGANNAATKSSGVVTGGSYNTNRCVFGTIGGGSLNLVQANYSATVAGGYDNSVFGQDATIGGGSYNTIHSNYTTIAGGTGNNADAQYAFIAGGAGNAISPPADSAVILGGQANQVDHANSIAAGHGAVSRFPNSFTRGLSFAQPGDGQCAEYILTASTGGFGLWQSLAGPPLPAGSAMAFTAVAVAKAFGDFSAAYEIKGLIRNYGGVVTFVGTPVKTPMGSTGYDNASINIDADAAGSSSNQRLQFQIHDPIGVNVRWVVRVQTSEVSY